MTPTGSGEERLARLRLSRTERIGPVTFAQLMKRYGSAIAALEALPTLIRANGRGAPLNMPSVESLKRENAALHRLGGRFLYWGDGEYPRQLAQIDAPPPVMALLGDASLLQKPAVAIVGSRNASAVGRQLARQFAAGLGEAGYIVVSGLARGIDGAAHEGSLTTGTIAVVAGGLDHIYPREHEALRDAIIEHGAILSERPLGTAPTARDFPRRNRYISGLSRAVLVVEAAERSGSLVTARFAGEQGRDVMAIPGSPLDPRARGTNRLLQDGAALVQTADDACAVLEAAPARLLEPEDPLFTSIPAPVDDDLVMEARDQILALLSPMPVSLDILVRESGLTPALVQAACLELELIGEITQHPGGQVRRAVPD